jgi:hypothetical protein
LVQKSVLLKVNETPSLKLAFDASVPPDDDVLPVVVVVPGVLPHATRIVATTTSTPSILRRLANFDFMVFSSQVPDSDARTLYFSEGVSLPGSPG